MLSISFGSSQCFHSNHIRFCSKSSLCFLQKITWQKNPTTHTVNPAWTEWDSEKYFLSPFGVKKKKDKKNQNRLHKSRALNPDDTSRMNRRGANKPSSPRITQSGARPRRRLPVKRKREEQNIQWFHWSAIAACFCQHSLSLSTTGISPGRRTVRRHTQVGSKSEQLAAALLRRQTDGTLLIKRKPQRTRPTWD